MRTRLWLLLVTLALGAATVHATGFCITVNDVCCDGEWSEQSYFPDPEYQFQTWYVYSSASHDSNRVEIEVWVEGSVLIWSDSLCDCATPHFIYPFANGHKITVRAKCEMCPLTGNSCHSGTAQVRVYTPRGNACDIECSHP